MFLAAKKELFFWLNTCIGRAIYIYILFLFRRPGGALDSGLCALHGPEWTSERVDLTYSIRKVCVGQRPSPETLCTPRTARWARHRLRAPLGAVGGLAHPLCRRLTCLTPSLPSESLPSAAFRRPKRRVSAISDNETSSPNS